MTTIELKSFDSNRSSSSSNSFHNLEKGEFDLFQWKDHNIGHIERMQLATLTKQKSSKSSWQIEWILVIHHGYTFTGAEEKLQSQSFVRCFSFCFRKNYGKSNNQIRSSDRY